MTTNPGTTNIAELPFNNVPLNSVEDGGNNVIENKIQNELNNRDQQTQIINNPNKELSNNLETNQNNNQMDYNSMINDLQKASQSGVTSLPSRDIPMNTNNIVIDNTINDNNSNINRLDKFYDNLQTPILLSILYFIFQLPIFKKYLLKYIPSLFKKDGN